jgi:hypothetical protein
MNRLVLPLAFTALLATPAEAIPAFARRYNMSCMTCHDPVPKLNAFGDRFAAQGFVLAEDDTVGMTTLGDPLLRLSTTFPIAVRLDAFFRYVSGSGARTDFQTPTVAKLLSGGQIAQDISYYVYFLLAERGETGPIEDAWLMFRRPFGVPADVTVGQFQIVDPLWKRELRVTQEDYAILSYRPGPDAARVTYDRGLIVQVSPTATTTVVGELVNGNGIGPAENGEFDGDAPKSGAAFLMQDVGPVTLALFGYLGRQRVDTGGGSPVTNRTRMIGPAALASLGAVDLGGQWLYRDDTDPDFSGSDGLVITRGGFLEANWWPMGRANRLLVTGLYNMIETASSTGDYETGTLNLSWLAARNLRLSGEVTYDLNAERVTVGFGVVTAF